MRRVVLHGRLAKRFGKEFHMEAATALEAVRALYWQVPGFREELVKGQYRVRAGTNLYLTNDALDLSLGDRDLHIIPSAATAGIETFLIVGLALAATVSVATVLFMRPSVPSVGDREAKAESFIFNGPTNVTEQGRPVPLVYGKRVRVGSVVVSAGLTASDIPASSLGNKDSTSPWEKLALFTAGYPGSPEGRDWEVMAKGGKGSGGSARSAQEEPNTLLSQQTARIIDVISEGEIGGLVNGLQSVFFDDTPVQNSDGSFNFSGVALEQRYGLPDQDMLANFSVTESTVPVGLDVTTTFGPVVRTITDEDVDVVRVTILLPALYQQDTENGDLKSFNVTLAIDVQSNGSGYSERVRDTIRGKQTGPYQRSYDIRLDRGSFPHDIRIRRVTPDSELVSEVNLFRWDTLTEITEAKLYYPDTALMGLTIDARQFGTTIPTRAYEIEGIKVEVPSNYDPDTRAYTGFWDGTFKRAVTDNPAWILRDLMTNRRYGTGGTIGKEIPDKYALYAIAQYCDQPVPDGRGGHQPRYTLNCCINSEAEAYDVFASVASNFRGMVYWGSGTVMFTQDRPEDPSMLVTPANVVGGKFNYARAIPLRKRRTVAVVYWNDPNDAMRLTPEIVEDPELIRRFGWRPGSEITAFGVTNRAQAHRMARWVLEDERYGSITVSYEAGDDHAYVEPSRVVSLEDPRFSLRRRGGRAASSTATSLTIDAPLLVTAGDVCTVRVMLPDGSVAKRALTNPAGDHTTLTWAEALPSLPVAGAVWSVETSSVANRQFRIHSISADGPPYAATATLHDPGKYARVEEGVDLSMPNFIGYPEGPIGLPGELSVLEYLAETGTSTVPAVQISWRGSSDPRIQSYQARYQEPGDSEWKQLPQNATTTRSIMPVTAGVWRFQVRAVDSMGHTTPWVTSEVTLTAYSGLMPAITGLGTRLNNDALTAVLFWDDVEDPRPIRYEAFFGETPVFLSATRLGIYDTTELVVTQAGFYWVRSVFMTARGAANMLEITRANLPAVDVDLEQLEHDIEVALQAASDAAALASQLEHDVSLLEQEAGQLETDIRAAEGEIETISSTVATQGSAITQNATAISNMAGDLASLQVTVGTFDARITTNSTAVSNLNLTMASLETRVSASSPNLLVNANFSNGLNDWLVAGVWQAASDTTVFRNHAYALKSEQPGGQFADGTHIRQWFNGVRADLYYTLSADVRIKDLVSGSAHLAIVCFDASNALIDVIFGPAIQEQEFDGTGANRQKDKLTIKPPAGTVAFDAYLHAGNNFDAAQIAVRGFKLEIGQTATNFTDEASVTQSFKAINTVGLQVATLSSTVAVQGASITQNATAINNVATQVSTLSTQVTAGGGNLLGNSTFHAGSSAGWGYWTGVGADPTINGPDENWHPIDSNALTIHQPNEIVGESQYWSDVTVESNKWYEVSVYAASHRCDTHLEIHFYDATNNHLGGTGVLPVRKNGGKYLQDWAHTAVKYQAPPGSAYGRIILKKWATTIGGADSWAWFCRPQFAETLENSASPLAYSATIQAVVDQQMQAINTATTQVATLSSTVSTYGVTINQHSTAISTTQGDVTTLMGRAGVTIDVNGRVTGWALNNNGWIGTMDILADRFRVTQPGGGAKMEWLTDGSGRPTIRVDDGAGSTVEIGYLA